MRQVENWVTHQEDSDFSIRDQGTDVVTLHLEVTGSPLIRTISGMEILSIPHKVHFNTLNATTLTAGEQDHMGRTGEGAISPTVNNGSPTACSQG